VEARARARNHPRAASGSRAPADPHPAVVAGGDRPAVRLERRGNIDPARPRSDPHAAGALVEYLDRVEPLEVDHDPAVVGGPAADAVPHRCAQPSGMSWFRPGEGHRGDHFVHGAGGAAPGRVSRRACSRGSRGGDRHRRARRRWHGATAGCRRSRWPITAPVPPAMPPAPRSAANPLAQAPAPTSAANRRIVAGSSLVRMNVPMPSSRTSGSRSSTHCSAGPSSIPPRAGKKRPPDVEAGGGSAGGRDPALFGRGRR